MKPILFNTPMVRAILEGRKTVTRRVVKPQPKSGLAYICMGHNCFKWSYPSADAWQYWNDESYKLADGLTDEDKGRRWTPPCCTGDVLYVRETWNYAYLLDGNEQPIEETGRYYYAADGPGPSTLWVTPDGEYKDAMPWRPSIHMPREAARIFLRVKRVRVERLQAISAYDLRAEGTTGRIGATLGAFASLWDSTIPKKDFDRYGWAANPWVWVIEFERISKEEAGGA